jgi:regulator of replication initiation timing
MGADSNPTDEQHLSVKKQLLVELWQEVKRAVEIASALRLENENLKREAALLTAERDALVRKIKELEQMLTARQQKNNSINEKEKERVLTTAKDLIQKIDKQINLF